MTNFHLFWQFYLDFDIFAADLINSVATIQIGKTNLDQNFWLKPGFNNNLNQNFMPSRFNCLSLQVSVNSALNDNALTIGVACKVIDQDEIQVWQ